MSTKYGERSVNMKVAELVKKYAEFLVEICLQGNNFFNPLQLACGCLAVARKQMKIRQIWTEELELMTGVKYRGIENTIKIIETYYESAFVKAERRLPRTSSNYNSNKGVSVLIRTGKYMK